MRFIFPTAYATKTGVWIASLALRPALFLGVPEALVALLEIKMPSKRPAHAMAQNPLLVLSPCPLGMAEWTIVEQALSDTAPDWSVELVGTGADETSLVLLPDGGDDEIGPSFIISREGSGLRLDQLHWDVMNEIGTYSTLTDVIAAVRVRLAFGSCLANQGWLTRH